MATATRAETIRVSNRMGTGCDNAPPRFYGSRRASAHLRLAQTWACSVRVARERYERVFRDAADVVVALMSMGQHDRLAEKMAPMDAAMAAWKVVPPLPDALMDAARADAAEDVAETNLAIQRTREAAREYVKASARARRHAELVEASLIREYEL